MKSKTIDHCGKCQKPVVSQEDSGCVCFKIPGEESYQFFHNRFRSGDCWEAYLKEGNRV